MFTVCKSPRFEIEYMPVRIRVEAWASHHYELVNPRNRASELKRGAEPCWMETEDSSHNIEWVSGVYLQLNTICLRVDQRRMDYRSSARSTSPQYCDAKRHKRELQCIEATRAC